MAEEGVMALHYDLPAAGNVEMAQPPDVMSEGRTLRWSVHIEIWDWSCFRGTAYELPARAHAFVWIIGDSTPVGQFRGHRFRHANFSPDV